MSEFAADSFVAFAAARSVCLQCRRSPVGVSITLSGNMLAIENGTSPTRRLFLLLPLFLLPLCHLSCVTHSFSPLLGLGNEQPLPLGRERHPFCKTLEFADASKLCLISTFADLLIGDGKQLAAP